MYADHQPTTFKRPHEDYKNYLNIKEIKNRDVIYINPIYLDDFIENQLKILNKKVILVINHNDFSFPHHLSNFDNFNELISSPFIHHMFIQNCSVSDHPKITQIPIGICFHLQAYNNVWQEKKRCVEEQEKILLSIRNFSLSKPRIIQAFGDFHLNDTIKKGNRCMSNVLNEDRTSIYESLKNSPATLFLENRLPRSNLWKIKAKYAFSICPHGNGYDTYRVWEDLALGIIPIVKSSPLDPLYKQFPIAIVSDWNEITLDNLVIWYQKYKDEILSESTFKKLKLKYWLDKIDNAKKSIIESE
jgi:hypothetical protein